MSFLPEPPVGREGWPWIKGDRRASTNLAEAEWPRVTVVTPSFNQVEFIEETIRSVLLQGYPNLEYIVIDSGSTDGSVEIIERYSPWLTYWCSEPDRGQSHAINKGFERATGEVMGWINSDDIFYPGALHTAAEALTNGHGDIFLGGMVKVRPQDGRYAEVKRSTPYEGIPIHAFRILADGPRHDFHFYQPSLFWRRSLWEEAGPLDERYHYVMDVEWCNRALACGAEVCLSDRPLARFLLHDNSKSVSLEERWAGEYVRMYLEFGFRSDFRLLPCLLSALRPAQRLLWNQVRAEQARGSILRAEIYRTVARAMGLLRFLLPDGVRYASDAARKEDN